MTFRAIFYDRLGRVSATNRALPADDPEHLPDIILVVPGPITYDHHGHDPDGRQVYRERVTDEPPCSRAAPIVHDVDPRPGKPGANKLTVSTVLPDT